MSFVGIYDMLRVELDPNGEFNVTEFGTVKNPEQFQALYAYSPYHRVKDGTAYPAFLMLTGENDHRVHPVQSRRMVARIEASQGLESSDPAEDDGKRRTRLRHRPRRADRVARTEMPYGNLQGVGMDHEANQSAAFNKTLTTECHDVSGL